MKEPKTTDNSEFGNEDVVSEQINRFIGSIFLCVIGMTGFLILPSGRFIEGTTPRISVDTIFDPSTLTVVYAAGFQHCGL